MWNYCCWNIVVTEEALDEQLNMVGQANQMTKEQVLEKIDLEGFKRDLSRMQASRIIVNNAVEKIMKIPRYSGVFLLYCIKIIFSWYLVW